MVALTSVFDDPRVQPSRTVRPMAATVATVATSFWMAASFGGFRPILRAAG
jgi:hypothetical protein